MSEQEKPRPPLPPFDAASAAQKVRMAEDAWNTRDPQRVAPAYTPDSVWRNRSEFLSGREAIVEFLVRKWNRELDYRPGSSSCGRSMPIASPCASPTSGATTPATGFAPSGNENWEFDEQGFMRRRIASINDQPIPESERKYRWPPGRRPDDHASLAELGL